MNIDGHMLYSNTRHPSLSSGKHFPIEAMAYKPILHAALEYSRVAYCWGHKVGLRLQQQPLLIILYALNPQFILHLFRIVPCIKGSMPTSCRNIKAHHYLDANVTHRLAVPNRVRVHKMYQFIIRCLAAAFSHMDTELLMRQI